MTLLVKAVQEENGIISKKKSLSSFQIIIFGFLAVILVGTLLLMLALHQGAGKRAISGCVIYSYIGYLCDRADRP